MTFKKKSSVLTGLLAFSLLYGCSEDRHEYDNKNAYEDSQISCKSLTLLGKEVRTYHNGSVAFLYFSVGEETNKVSVVAQKLIPCAKSSTKVFEARIGDKKTPNEWRQALTHRGEDKCPFDWAAEDRLQHKLTWSYVRED